MSLENWGMLPNGNQGGECEGTEGYTCTPECIYMQLGCARALLARGGGRGARGGVYISALHSNKI